MQMRKILFTMLIIISAFTCRHIQGHAEELNPIKGKTVRLSVGFSPGGGIDLYARLIAPYLGKALEANVIVENQPGAGGLIALNSMTSAPKDGTKISLINGSGAALSQIMGEKAVRYELEKFTFLGNIDAPPWVWLTSPNSNLNSKEIILSRPNIAWGATGVISGMAGAAAVTCATLAIECKIVPGYPGTNDAALALGKAEIDSMFGMDSSIVTFIKAGNAKPFVAIGHKRSKFFPDVPLFNETFQLNERQMKILQIQVALQDLGRMLIAPPDLEPQIASALQVGVAKALQDPELIAQGIKTGQFIDFIPAEATRKAANDLLSQTPEERTRTQNILKSFN